MSKKVIVALSGGVDSSVSAALLQKEGYAVEGVFMKNWSPATIQSLSDCPWERDQADAEAVCDQLGIPFRSINFEQEYREKVVDYLLQEYQRGRTPNPDVMCNREIKFAAFFTAAQKLGADYIATGHYAQVKEGLLYRGRDPKKDQSYFLYTLGSTQLERTLFPVGGMEKADVRQIAAQFQLPTSAKKDSQGICFIGHLNLKEFLQDELGQQPGEVRLLPPCTAGVALATREAQAARVGTHLGVAFHTIGERMGHYLDNRWYKMVEPEGDIPSTFVVSKNIQENIVFISNQREDTHLYITNFFLESLIRTGKNASLSTVEVLTKIKKGECQIRYQQHPVRVHDVQWEGEGLAVVTDPLWAVAEGQSAVFYLGEEVIGGGTICATR